MFTHIMVGSNNPDEAIAFYDAVLGAIGIQGKRMGESAFYSDAKGGAFGVGKPRNGEPATFANGGTIGFSAKTRAEVDAFYAAGCSNGCLLYTSPSPRDLSTSRMPSSA